MKHTLQACFTATVCIFCSPAYTEKNTTDDKWSREPRVAGLPWGKNSKKETQSINPINWTLNLPLKSDSSYSMLRDTHINQVTQQFKDSWSYFWCWSTVQSRMLSQREKHVVRLLFFLLPLLSQLSKAHKSHKRVTKTFLGQYWFMNE